MSMSVKISVIMPVYNTPEPQLRKALSSVLEQDMPDFELIICDDGSEPFVQKIIGMCSDPRIKYLRNKENKGCACSLNRCIQEAQGELLIRQDSDDYSLQGRFAALKAAYEQTGADIIASNIMLFDDSGEWGHRDYPETPTKNDFLFAVPFMHGACALKKSAVLKAGMYPVSEKTARCEEYAMFMTMYSQGAKGMNLQKRLYAFREDSAARSRRSYGDKLKEVRVKAEGFKKLGLYPKGIIYLAKPLVVGLIPQKLLEKIKDRVFDRRS